MRKGFVLFALLMASLVVLQPATAKPHKKQAKGIVITSVDVIEKKIVMTIQDSKQSLSYTLPLGTTITINEEPASMGQIHAGMSVVSYTEADEHVLSQLDVESKKVK